MRGQGRWRLRVLLVVMPFAASERPALGVSLLKAHLGERGVVCDVAYLNLLFAERIGRLRYERLVNDLPFRALPGEWVFAATAWESADLPDTYIEDVLRGRWQLAAEDVGLVRRARGEAEPFLAEAIASLPWDDYDLVGFSSCASQNLASLALARRVKEVDPGMPVVFGGANWHGTPGKTLHERIEVVDFALSGEADISFPLLVDWLAGEPGVSLSEIPGLGYRQDGASRWNPEDEPIRDLDGLPTPDFSDFYAWRHRLPDVRSSLPSLVLEASRGCWWASTGPCAFCGMDHRDREYRAKSAGRVIRELREVTSSWPALHVHMADTVVPPAFLDGVVPEFARTSLGARLFVEVRPGLTRRQLLDLARTRALIQPGIESFSDHLLGLMRKGSRGLENIRLLKWCRALDLRVQWNLLYGVPGETQEDYDEMFALFPSIRFLPPPRFCQCISVDRHSPYFLEPERHGIHELRPLAAYRYLYPFQEEVLSEIAYTFDYECRADSRLADVGERLEREVAEWQRWAPLGDLRMGPWDGGRLTLIDKRPGASARTIELDELDSILYDGCEDIAGVDVLVAGVAGGRLTGDVTDGLVRARLDRLVEQRLMVRMAGRYLALALPAADE